MLQLKSSWSAQNAPVQLAEAIFVLDDPADHSPDLLGALASQHEWLRIITLSRCFGQHPATLAGILHSDSDWVVTVDEGLSLNPKMIHQLFQRVAETSCDIVYAHPQPTTRRPFQHTVIAKLSRHILRFLTDNPSVVKFHSFRLIRGPVARAASSVCSHDTYFDVALSWFSRRIALERIDIVELPNPADRRRLYSFLSLIRNARRIVISAQVKSLRVAILAGALGLGFSVIYGTYVVVRQLAWGVAPPVAGWSSLMVVSLFFGGIITLMIGILTELLSPVILHTQGKPVFFVIDRSSDPVLLPYFGRR
jgi:glycosyltransferase involved in cell wall biosynthesis